MDNMTADCRAKIAALKSTPDDCRAAREMTVGEMLDRRIATVARLIIALEDLKNSLPASFLNGGVSRIAGILEL